MPSHPPSSPGTISNSCCWGGVYCGAKATPFGKRLLSIVPGTKVSGVSGSSDDTGCVGEGCCHAGLGLLAKDARRGRSDTNPFEMAFAWLTRHQNCLR